MAADIIKYKRKGAGAQLFEDINATVSGESAKNSTITLGQRYVYDILALTAPSYFKLVYSMEISFMNIWNVLYKKNQFIK